MADRHSPSPWRQFEATFQGNSWSFVFSGFVAVE